ncbi:ankyrin repeat protein [Moumouvirus australiensis]|uniref:Ankyrin repeat protein n=1 Tax=Moumouvirus australiensis TaxID=2109587 RepID=A0A2P1EMG9_9VIRU|nr:ankyrin repeat protein [Moumouvirus australiensis]AVL95083.1 ankyrin repeat protein [Moumouvirus australiensis]
MDKYEFMFTDYDPDKIYNTPLIYEKGFTKLNKLMYLIFNKDKFPKNLILDYIKDHPEQINEVTLNNFTPLTFELSQINNPYIVGQEYNHDLEIFEYLLSNGADPNLNTYGLSPLFLCVVNNTICHRYKFFRLLLKYGANVNHYTGCTSIMHKTVLCDYKILKLSLKYNPDINIKDIDGFTPLMLLFNILKKTQNENDINTITEKIKLLLEHNCDPFTKDNSGFNIFCKNKVEQDLYNKILGIEKYKTFIRIISNKIFKRSETILMAPGSLRYNLLLIKWNNYDYEYVNNHFPQIINYFKIYDEKDFDLKIFDALKYLN